MLLGDPARHERASLDVEPLGALLAVEHGRPGCKVVVVGHRAECRTAGPREPHPASLAHSPWARVKPSSEPYVVSF